MSLQDLVKYRDSGELSDVTVAVDGEELKLHKFPLYIKSDHFKDEAGKDRVELAEFPGGAACFKLIADFCYNKRIDIGLDNVAQLRCGAEYLKMSGDNNLIDLTERYLDDVLRSAQMSRSLAPIVDLIGRTACLGPAAEQAKTAERCFGAVMDVWTKPGRVDTLVVDRLLRLPLGWFERLAKSCSESPDTERHLRPLAELSSRYLHRVFQRECQQEQKKQDKQKPQKQQQQQKPVKEAKKKAEKEKDEDGGEEAAAAEAEAAEQQEQQEQAEAEASDAEADADKDGKKQQKPEDCEPKEPAGEVLDRVIASLPEAAPLGDVVNGEWIRQALQVSEKYSCECRPRLLQLAGNILHRFRQEELRQMPSPVLCDIVSSSVLRGEGAAEPEVLSGVVDNHLLGLARAGGLSPEDFAKLAGSVPADYRACHDTLYEAAETLLTAGESIPDDQQKAVIDAVDLSRCDVATLQRALDKGAFPAKVVCQAAIDLAQRSRQQGSPEVKSARREDFKPSLYSSPSRRYRASPGYDAAGYNSYREPAATSSYTAKYEVDFDSSRYSSYDAPYSDGDRATRLDFQTSSSSRNYTRKW